jgi:hypothetical protein
MFLLLQLLFSAEIILFPFYTRALALARKKYWAVTDSGRVIALGFAYSGVRVLGWIIIYIMVKAAESRSEGLFKSMGWIFILVLWAGTVLYILQVIQYLFLLWRARPIVK